MTRLHIDPEDFKPLIDASVDAAIRQHMDRRPRDEAGRVLVTKREAARMLSTSEATVDRWRLTHGLPSVKCGGKVLFRPAALEQWAAGQEVVG